MDNWPKDSDIRLIIDFYKEALRDQPGKPLLEYMRRKNIGWNAVAPIPPFNRGEVHRWATGERKLTPSSIGRIKRASNIPNTEVPHLSDREIYSGAAADTMAMIREEWFARPGEPPQILTPHQALALEYIVKRYMRDAQRRAATDQASVYLEILQLFPQVGWRSLDDFIRFQKDCWLHAHVVFKDALLEGDLADEFEQATNL